jgi:hypothetical protein
MQSKSPCGNGLPDFADALVQLNRDTLAMPFDMARAHYATSVQLGLIERSMLLSAQFAKTLSALEALTLGPLARHH